MELDGINQPISVPDIEKSVLGSFLLDASNLKYLDQLESNDFTRYQSEFDAIRFLHHETGEIDRIELESLVNQNNQSFDASIFFEDPSPRPEYHISILKEYTRRRKIRDLGYKITQAANEDPDSLPGLFEQLNAVKSSGRSLIDSARLDFSREIEAPNIAVTINGETFGTLGNFSLVIGKAKSRKTFLITLALAAAVSNNKVSDSFTGTLPPGKNRVIFIDTEQGAYHVSMVARRVLRLAGLSAPDNFDVYALRKFDTAQRNAIIEDLIRNTPDLGLLIIDGVRDIVTSINDEEQATDLANKLLKWTEERQIHIITVLHQNKSDFNARGHLGTELINKAEITVSVTVDPNNKEISKVEAEYCRHKEFEPFAIRINENGLPERVDGWVPKSESTTGKLAPGEVDEYKHFEVLQELKKNINGNKSGFNEVLDQIINVVSNRIQKIGRHKARDYFTEYINRGFIVKHGKDRSPNAYYEINSNFTQMIRDNGTINHATLN